MFRHRESRAFLLYGDTVTPRSDGVRLPVGEAEETLNEVIITHRTGTGSNFLSPARQRCVRDTAASAAVLRSVSGQSRLSIGACALPKLPFRAAEAEPVRTRRPG